MIWDTGHWTSSRFEFIITDELLLLSLGCQFFYQPYPKFQPCSVIYRRAHDDSDHGMPRRGKQKRYRELAG